MEPECIPSDQTLALSPMGMDIGLKVTIIIEQIYRAYCINNHPYHK
ncbi:23S rRNA (pseudouridine(1915)-N(3))-methyltransferase RlmH [Paenibacillus mendelii]|uniref:23S rRNA (Pseudouridine(1915)-N(3))-methyltransferase RlmH n=1 Tax=Paenibacillus mendelii TaxID=206163 RepID=A0ABV6JEN3_9BACL